MTRDRSRQIDRNLQAVLDAATDLIVEVGIPETGDGLRDAPRIQQLAFCECVRRVGEAVAQIDALDGDWLSANFEDIPWPAIKATRNRQTHRYWTVDFQIMHTIATESLPAVTAAIATHLREPDPYVAPHPTSETPIRDAAAQCSPERATDDRG